MEDPESPESYSSSVGHAGREEVDHLSMYICTHVHIIHSHNVTCGIRTVTDLFRVGSPLQRVQKDQLVMAGTCWSQQLFDVVVFLVSPSVALAEERERVCGHCKCAQTLFIPVLPLHGCQLPPDPILSLLHSGSQWRRSSPSHWTPSSSCPSQPGLCWSADHQ